MNSNPFAFIDAVINPIPVVGQLWADALYTVLGLSDAFNLRNSMDLPLPPPQADTIVEFAANVDPVELRHAA